MPRFEASSQVLTKALYHFSGHFLTWKPLFYMYTNLPYGFNVWSTQIYLYTRVLSRHLTGQSRPSWGAYYKQEQTSEQPFFSFLSGYYISPDCYKRIGPAKWPFVFFGVFCFNKSPKTPPLALHMLARSVPSKKVSSPVFAIEKP
jgi:hypothetical protein